jgi:hypothetical protein
MGAVAEIVEAPFKAVEAVGEAVGNAVSDVGNFVNKEIIQPVAKTVEKTVDAALKDPIGTAAKVVTAIYAPELLPLTNAGVALAHGASPEDALKTAAVTMVTQDVAKGVGDYVKPEMAETFTNPAVANAATNATANVAAAVATGQDPTQALVSSASMSTAGAIANEIPGFEDLSKTQKNAAVAAISATIQGKDATQAVINQAIADGIDAANKYVHADDKAYQDLLKTNPNIDTETLPNTPATTTDQLNQELFPADTGAETTPIPTPGTSVVQDVLAPATSDTTPALPAPDLPAPETPASATETPATETPAAATEPPAKETPAADQGFNNTELNDFYKSIGLDPESITKASAMTTDPLEMYSQAYDEQFLRDYYKSIGIDPDSISPAEPMQEDPLAYLNPDPIEAQQRSWGQMFKSLIPANLNAPSSSTKQSSIMPLLQNAALYGGAALAASALLDQNGNPVTSESVASEPTPEQSFAWNQVDPTAPIDGVAYGQAILNPKYHAAQGGLMSLARGGISTLGGYSDGGRLLKGPGDGMSDNIPAMIGQKQPARLADGEFVVPADVVSHLGNGSTEAGANVLYKMMEKVRRARTGNVKQGRQINPNKFIPS